jgi:hypothetical protein
MNNYELAVTFRTVRPLTSGEVADLLNRVGLELGEPTTTDEDGLPTDADWSGRSVRMLLIDEDGKEVGSWRW